MYPINLAAVVEWWEETKAPNGNPHRHRDIKLWNQNCFIKTYFILSRRNCLNGKLKSRTSRTHFSVSAERQVEMSMASKDKVHIHPILIETPEGREKCVNGLRAHDGIITCNGCLCTEAHCPSGYRFPEAD